MLQADRALLFLHDRSPIRRDPVVSPDLLALLVGREPAHAREAEGRSTYIYEVERAELARLEALGEPQRQREMMELSAELRGLAARLAALGLGDASRLAQLGAQGALCVAIGERLAAGVA